MCQYLYRLLVSVSYSVLFLFCINIVVVVVILDVSVFFFSEREKERCGVGCVRKWEGYGMEWQKGKSLQNILHEKNYYCIQ